MALWCSWLARRTVAPKIAGSSPARVAIYPCSSDGSSVRPLSGRLRVRIAPRVPHASVAQLVRASGSYPEGQWFKSTLRYQAASYIGSTPGFDPDVSVSTPLAAATSAPIAQMDRATVFYTVRWRFESALGFHTGA